MYMQLLLFIFCCTAQIVYTYDQIDPVSFPTQEQEFLLKKDQLQQAINNFHAKLEKLRNHSEFSNLVQNITLATLFQIAEEHAAILQNMTPSEFNGFYISLEDHFKNLDEADDSIAQFKQAIEFLQKTLLPQYSVNELFAFGILYEFFDDYIQINQAMFAINAQ